jgi:hypothetical protein
MIFYALFYLTYDNEKSANAISTDFDSLLKLHYSSISNLECYYHNYKKSIKYITVGPIDIYIYKDNGIHKLDIDSMDENDFNLNQENRAFYSSCIIVNDGNGNLSLKEILIYLTKEDHKIWRKIREDIDNNNNNNIKVNDDVLHNSFFYGNSISYNNVIPDTYYEEGIINA